MSLWGVEDGKEEVEVEGGDVPVVLMKEQKQMPLQMIQNIVI